MFVFLSLSLSLCLSAEVDLWNHSKPWENYDYYYYYNDVALLFLPLLVRRALLLLLLWVRTWWHFGSELPSLETSRADEEISVMRTIVSLADRISRVSMPSRSVHSWIQVRSYRDFSSWSSIIDCIPDRAPPSLFSTPTPFFPFLKFAGGVVLVWFHAHQISAECLVFLSVLRRIVFACVRILYSMCFSSWIFGNYPLYFDAISSHEFWTRVP